MLESNQSEISSELERASRSVRKLGSLLFEMEVLRSFLETESEIKYFDKRVVPCKIRAYVAIQKLKGDYFSYGFDTQVAFSCIPLELSCIILSLSTILSLFYLSQCVLVSMF